MKTKVIPLMLAMACFLGSVAAHAAQPPKTVTEVHPRLAIGALTFAKVTELPEDVLLQAGDMQVKAEQIDKIVAAQPPQLQEDLRKNAYLVLEQRAASEILLSLAKQAVLARDNPVDKARDSGKPSLVDFGATGCGPCDMMTPILENLKVKYEGKLNVLFVHVRERQILGAKYGIQTIPVQVFFDKDGKEVFRHVGFFPQEEIERKLAEMGVAG